MRAQIRNVGLLMNVAVLSLTSACGLDWSAVGEEDAAIVEREPDAGAADGAQGADARVDAGLDADAPEAMAEASTAAPVGDASPRDDAALDAGGAEGGVLGSSLADGRVLLLHLDEAQYPPTPGEVRDQSGLAHHGTVMGTGLTSGAGRFATALAFSGTGWVEVADAASLRPSAGLTVSAWFWLDVLPGSRWPGIVSKRTAFGQNTAFAMFLSPDNRVVIDVEGEESRFFSKATISAGRWYHVALTFDGTLPAADRVKLYIDGQLDTTAAEPSPTIAPHASPLMIGNLPVGGDTMIGRIDEVGMWTRALTAAELGELARSVQP